MRTQERSPSDIRAKALDDAARAIDQIVADEFDPPGMSAEDAAAWRDELRRIARVHSENARRVRSKGREAAGWVQGEVYEMQTRRLEGAWAVCRNRGLAVTLAEVKSILLDREWTDPNHQAWLDKALADDIFAVVATKVEKQDADA